MSTKDDNMKNGGFPDEMESLISGSRIRWTRSREEVWLELDKKLDVTGEARKVTMVRPWMRFAAAAVMTLLVGLSAVMYFYSETLEVGAGKHAEILLPDNSRVQLNAQSTISYKPLLWYLSRSVELEGEAFFEVTKGRRFEVVSGNGRTRVLGTSFNVFSRNSDYRVTCITGKVGVTEASGRDHVILTPGQQALLSDKGIIETVAEADTVQALSWMNNTLSFTASPLEKVLDEISRQYNITIEIGKGAENRYTGTFIKDDSVENVLNLVCRPFDMKIIRKSENVYLVTSQTD